MNPLGSYLPFITREYPKLKEIFLALVEQLNLINARIQLYTTGQVEINRLNLKPDPLPNLNVNGFIFGKSVSAVFSSTIAAVGAGVYLWDTEIFSSSVDHFARTTAYARVEIRQEGTYLVSVTALIKNLAGQSDVGLFLNGVIQQYSRVTATATGTTHNLTLILEMKIGDYLTVQNLAGDRFGDANRYSMFTITRLN